MAVATKTEQKPSRTTQRSITAALAAIQAQGLLVEKVTVNGGQVEIHILQIDEYAKAKNEKDMEIW